MSQTPAEAAPPPGTDTDGYELGGLSVLHVKIEGGPLTADRVAAVEGLCDRVEDAAAAGAAPAGVVLRLGLGPGEEPPPHDPAPVHLVNKWERALRRLERVSAPTLAVARGICSGVAVEALLSCDHRIGAEDLRLRLPFTAGAPWPGMLVHRLANQLGVARARGLVLFGTEVPAERALHLGLVDEIAADLKAALEAQIKLISGLSGTELAIRRRLLLEAAATTFEDALGTHLAACDRLARRAAASAQAP
ncbi:enoyl-CoA-hydratase DpgB [Thermopolyspora sp. NPDC052614]|uniref:enoyl-CoA-hydratase DpgB n=1 Tax=Thermopolyspora sp. NPDC052614 TaxID=3155682 RepID=UPI00341C01D3